MSASQLSLFPAPTETSEWEPDLLGCALAYYSAGRLDWHDVVNIDASGPPTDWRKRVYREALADYRKRRAALPR